MIVGGWVGGCGGVYAFSYLCSFISLLAFCDLFIIFM